MTDKHSEFYNSGTLILDVIYALQPTHMQVSSHTRERTLKSTHTRNSELRKYSIANFTHNIATSVLISCSEINQACRLTMKFCRKT